MTMLEVKRGQACAKPPSTPLTRLQRIEGAALAAVTVVLFLDAGYAWWWLPALFLLFDLSMLGYARSVRVGAVVYNAVHDYPAPAVLVAVTVLGQLCGVATAPLGIVAGCWFFHVALDRAFGYGPRPTSEEPPPPIDRLGN